MILVTFSLLVQQDERSYASTYSSKSHELTHGFVYARARSWTSLYSSQEITAIPVRL